MLKYLLEDIQAMHASKESNQTIVNNLSSREVLQHWSADEIMKLVELALV